MRSPPELVFCFCYPTVTRVPETTHGVEEREHEHSNDPEKFSWLIETLDESITYPTRARRRRGHSAS
jgi:hypothetical protein